MTQLQGIRHPIVRIRRFSMPISTSLRSLTRTRGLSLTVVLTIAIGVAALTITFGVVNAALWRQPPFPESDRLAMLFLQRNPPGEPSRRERWSFARYNLLAESQDVFEQVASYSPGALTVSGAGSGDAELIQGERISATYFTLLGVSAARGRLFTESEDDGLSPTPVVVLGHQLWIRRFASDPGIIGRDIRLNGVPLTVIGVMPAGFSGLSGRAELWVPRTMTPQLTYAEYLTTNQNFISAVGRLKAGVDFSSAQTRLEVLGASINRAIPSDPAFPDERVTASAVGLNEARADPTVRRSLFIVLAAVAVLHLLACVNVINLLLGREAARRHESAVRIALGSSGLRLFRHLSGEGLLLGLVGGAAGLGLAAWGSAVITPPTNVWAPRNFYGSLAPFDSPQFGVTELAFGIGLALVTAVLIALPPALRAFGVDVLSGIRTGARGITDNAITLRRPSARGLIVALEAALAMLLVVVAGLLIDSFQRMRQTGIGVDTENVLTFWVIPSEARIPPASAASFVSRLIESVSRVPGVRSVSVDGGAPLAGSASTTLYVAGRPAPRPAEAPPVLRHYIAPGHFATLGIPVKRGRAFTSSDVAGSPRVVIISETAARRFWPSHDPLGQRVWFGGGSNFNSPDSSAEIVGIVGDVVYAPLDQRPNFASFYTPYGQFTYASRMVFVKTAADPMSMVPAVRQAITALDPELAMQDVQPLARVVSGSWARHRFDALLFGGFGVAALLLAASGIFAVLSYAVASRTREFGIRIALGADSGRVVRHVLREGLIFPVAGLVVGVVASLAVTRLLQSSLYDVTPQEPRVFAGTAVLLAIVAAAACLIPAWRATRVDPSEALRSD
jgi:putative ABC transport system permease protein